MMKDYNASKHSRMFFKILYSTRVMTYLFAMLPGLFLMNEKHSPVSYYVFTIATCLLMPHVEELIRHYTTIYKKVDEYLFISPAFTSAILTGLMDYSVFVLLGSSFLSYLGPLVVAGKQNIPKYIIATILGLLVGGYINGFKFDQVVSVTMQLVSMGNVMTYCLIMAIGMYLNANYLKKSRDILSETTNTNAIFNKIIKKTSGTLSIDNIMHSLLTVFSESYFESIAFLLHNEKTNTLKVNFFEGAHSNKIIGRLIRDIIIPINTGENFSDSYILQTFYQNKAMYFFPTLEPEKLSPIDFQFYSILPYHGLFIIPLSVEKKIIGLMMFFSVQKKQRLKPMQLELFNNYLLQLGVIMNNALIHQQLTDEIHKIKTEMNRYERLQNELSKYLSPKIYKHVFESYQHIGISSQYKFLTICSTDIVGFTALSEHLEPEEMTQMLNYYLTEMNNITFKYDGTVDKYLGDSIQIFFGDPTSNGKINDALRCCQMALEMQEKVRGLQHIWIQHGISKQLTIRIGIHSDFCSVGNFGSQHQIQYSIVGEPTHIATDLQTRCPPGQVLISNNTYNLVKNYFKLREIPGFDTPVYEIIK